MAKQRAASVRVRGGLFQSGFIHPDWGWRHQRLCQPAEKWGCRHMELTLEELLDLDGSLQYSVYSGEDVAALLAG